jgi:hypothetical protein
MYYTTGKSPSSMSWLSIGAAGLVFSTPAPHCLRSKIEAGGIAAAGGLLLRLFCFTLEFVSLCNANFAAGRRKALSVKLAYDCDMDVAVRVRVYEKFKGNNRNIEESQGVEYKKPSEIEFK